jgi:hypothetical protein
MLISRMIKALGRRHKNDQRLDIRSRCVLPSRVPDCSRTAASGEGGGIRICFGSVPRRVETVGGILGGNYHIH